MPKRELLILLCLLAMPGTGLAAQITHIPTDRQWTHLPDPALHGPRQTLAAAARAMDDWSIRLAGVAVDARRLTELAAIPDEEPLLRALREDLGRPVDLDDFLLLLDDLLAAGDDGLRGRDVHLPSGRARRSGILLHPDDVFGDEPRTYGGGRLAIYAPRRPAEFAPADDGEPLGMRWTARYRNPTEEGDLLAALKVAGNADFARRIADLLGQLRSQGAEAYVFSTVRSRERGYLMYGAFRLSRAQGPEELRRRVAELQRLNREWGLNVPIRWRHPDGWRATIEAAGRMAAAYNVVYATRRGARYSSHYGADATDFAAMDLPRTLTLTAPDGSRRRFDLSAPDHPRDLNLAPALIRWVEAHFGLGKLRGDYPHWSDAEDRRLP